MASRTIGYVTRAGEGFVGEIKTLGLRASVEIQPNRRKAAEKQPDFLVFAEGVECGAGWLAEPKPDLDYRSISCAIDDPSLSAPLYFNTGRAPGREDADAFALIWNRR